MTVIEQWWRIRKPDRGGTIWTDEDPTPRIDAGRAPAWEGSTVDGPFVLASTTEGAVSLDDPKLIETLARVIENRHGTLRGIGNTLREALAELKRGQ